MSFPPLPPDPITACARLRRLRGRALLHSGRNDDELGGCSFVAAAPVATLIARGRSLVLLDEHGRPAKRWSGDPIDAVAAFLAAHGAPLRAEQPTSAYPRVIGYLGYDLGRAAFAAHRLGRGPSRGDDCPDVWLGAYDAVVRYPDTAHSATARSAPLHSATAHSAPPHSATARSAPPHSATAHSATAHSATAHSATAHSAPPHSATAHSAPPHSATAHSATAHSATAHSAPAHSAPAHSATARSAPARSAPALAAGAPAPGATAPTAALGAAESAAPQLLGSPEGCARLAARLADPDPSLAAPHLPPGLGPLTADDSPDHHRARVERILEYIAAGDVYQVNLARRHVAAVRAPGDALALYRILAAATPAPYGALLEADGITLLSSSPERFLRVEDGRVETRPIKGTRPRKGEPVADRAAAAELLAAEKDSAEHLMIVDLERNDLGRIAEVGSVAVDDLGYVVDFATVLHRVSRISAQLRPDIDHAALLRATFPGGSITGAPKLRAMQIIDELEPARRGPYCGALGYFGAGELDLAIAIRVGALTSGELRIHVGGGIVADSDPGAELAETEDKLAGWRRALAAVEDAARAPAAVEDAARAPAAVEDAAGAARREPSD